MSGIANAAPSNDLCQNAISFSGTTAQPFDTRGGQVQSTYLSCAYTTVGATDIWYLYTATETGLATIGAENCLIDGDNQTFVTATVFDTCTGSEMPGLCVGDICYERPLVMPISAGTTYLLRISTYVDSETFAPTILVNGTATLKVSEQAIATPNDECEDGTPVVEGSVVIEMPAATPSGAEYGCGTNPGGSDVWFAYTANTTGMAVIQLDGDEAVVISALDECGGTVLACDPAGYPNRCFLPITEGETYRVRVAKSWPTAQSSRNMTITEYLSPTNDACAGATTIGSSVVLNGAAASIDWDNSGAHDDDSEGPLCAIAEASIWYSYVPASNGIAVFSTEGMDVDTVIAAYAGCGGQLLSCNSSVGINSSDRSGMVAVKATAGQRLYVRIAVETNNNFSSHYRQGKLSVQLVSPQTNDECAGATVVTPNTYIYNNRTATTSSQAAPACSINGVKDLWYAFTPSSAGQVVVSTCGSVQGTKVNIDPYLAVYAGGCSAGTLVACNDNDNEEHCSPNGYSYLSFNASAQTTYLIRLGSSTDQSPGDGRLVVSFTETACPADFNTDGARDVADLFAYINAWLAKTPNANFNGDSSVDVADLFAYINAWLAGC